MIRDGFTARNARAFISFFPQERVCSCAAQRLIMYQTNAPEKNSTKGKYCNGKIKAA